MNRKTIASIFLIVVIVAGLFASTVLYFRNIISDMSSQIRSLNFEVFDKIEQPYVVTKLGMLEVMNNVTYNENDPSTYNHLLIYGTVTNMGFSTAYNTGLHVVAMDSSGEVVIDMTVPVTAGSYGLGDNQGSSTLSILLKQEILQTQIIIYHKGIATTWTVTPVYTS